MCLAPQCLGAQLLPSQDQTQALPEWRKPARDSVSGDRGNLPTPLRHTHTPHPRPKPSQAMRLLSIYHAPNTVVGSVGECKERTLFPSKYLQPKLGEEDPCPCISRRTTVLCVQ